MQHTHSNGESHEHQARLFNSIVVHLEEQNKEIMTKLKVLQTNSGMIDCEEHLPDNHGSLKHQQNPIESCQSMQHQLQRLKGLVDNIFGENLEHKQRNLESTSNQLTEAFQGPNISEINTPKLNHNEVTLNNMNLPHLLPHELIESTPLCNRNPRNPNLDENGKKNKLLSRSTIHHEFSPILLKDKQNKKFRHLELDTLQESNASRSLVRNRPTTNYESLISPESIAVDDILGENSDHLTPHDDHASNAIDIFPFSRMSLHELTSLLVKTGKIVPSFDNEHVSGNETFNANNVTRLLDARPTSDGVANNQETKVEIMEELESLMLRLENVFEAYHHSSNQTSSTQSMDHMKKISSVHLQQIQKEQDPMVIGQIVSEIVDQIHSFNYQCLGNVQTQSQTSSSPSITRSDGDGLSSPEPPVRSHSNSTEKGTT